ncbi:MAG TPA: TraB/GumN family protein [Dongiaceae bacterium]|nr:TraB/GumN family protein [Dongiaceae bacterium]
MRRLLAALLLLLGVPAGALADPAMWVVKGADSTVYLLGTIHALKPGVDWRSEKLESAFKASVEYWMEADIQEDPAIAGTYILNFGTDSRHPLSEKLKPDEYAQFLRIVAGRGLSEAKVRFARPWFATLLLTGEMLGDSGYDPMNGVDRALETDAKQAGKTVKTFETPAEQLGFLAHLSPEVELAMLVDTLHELRGGTAGGGELDALSAAWLAGDTRGLGAAGFQRMRTDSPEMFDVIITRRNAAWVPKIADLLKTPGTYFIAVGAGHLIGKGGVPELLKAKGYKVERY